MIGSSVAAVWRYAAGVTDVLPSSRRRLRSGEWVVLHASPLTATAGVVLSLGGPLSPAGWFLDTPPTR